LISHSRKRPVLAACLLFLVTSLAKAGEIKDWLGLPGPVTLGGQPYELAWSSHPQSNLYLQEYLQSGAKLGHFGEMVLINVQTDTGLKDVVATKVRELEQRKREGDPLANEALYERDGGKEVMLDFILSQGIGDGDGKSAIVEHNVYRYQNVIDAHGRKVVLLLGLSERSYGAEIDAFLQGLKTRRVAVLDAVSRTSLPTPLLIDDAP
jgi:hypothetical protein